MNKVRNILYPNQNPYENMEVLPFNNHGWASNHSAFAEVIAEIKPQLIVEVGTWIGGSSRTMVEQCLANGIKDFEIVCIDTFLGSVEHWNRTSYLMTHKNGRPTIYEQFISNTIHAGYQNYVTPFPVDSQNGFLTLKHFNITPDLVYIDAGHDYFSVKNDLDNWSSILKPGGILIGDDYFNFDIKRAVKESLGEVEDRGNVKFFWRKPK